MRYWSKDSKSCQDTAQRGDRSISSGGKGRGKGHIRFFHTPSNRGFTLIEMAIVLIIVGIIISIVASVLPSLIATSKIKQAEATLERMDYALQGYLAANGRCPCPDTDNDGVENRTVGTTPPTDDTCAAYVGQIPYATIGLASALDPWQERVRYGVYQDLIRTQNTTLCSAAPCTLCLSDFSIHPNAAYLRTSDSANTTNQAYVILSGGPKDIDGSGGFFDARNGDATAEEFETPNRITDTAYDDLVRAESFAFLQGKLCSASLGGGSGGGGTGESPSLGNCADGLDNDADGTIDCMDAGCASDPACTGPTPLNITTASVPSGVLGSAYLTSFSATGGTTPYSWSLPTNGGFTDFAINAFTGSLSGTLTQCPGTYTIAAGLQDTTPAGSGGPFADSQTYSLEVTSTLDVSCTSTPGTAITWSSPTQVETFTANGSRIGAITWSLNSGGAAGFVVTSTGAATSRIYKTGSTAPGTYTFTLSATDATCAGNTDNLILQVTVTAAGGGTPGGISGVVDTLTYSTFESYTPTIIPVSGDIYSVVDRGSQGDGYAHTVDITTAGQIGSRIDYYEFDTSDALTPDIAHVAGDIYAVAYEGPSDSCIVKTITIGTDGQIANSTIDALTLLNNQCASTTIIAVSGNVFAVIYSGQGSDGFITTVQIAADGQIANSAIDILEYDTAYGMDADLIHIAGDVYAIAYRGSGNDGFVCTVSIDSAGQISNGVIDRIEFDTADGYAPSIVQVSGDIYAVAYQGSGSDGFVKTIGIATNGQITNSVLDSLEFDPNTGITPSMASAGNGILGIAYRGPADDGFFCTVLVDEAGQIGDTVQSSLEFNTSACYEPAIISLGGGLFAVAYRGPTGNQGVVTTIGLQ